MYLRPLHALELLQLWEEGLSQPLLEKSLRLLDKASNAEDLSADRFSIGERDVLLLQLRAWMFGPQIKNMVHCPLCGEVVEWETPVADLQFQQQPETFSVRTFTLQQDQYTVQFRLPASADISAVIAGTNGQPANALLNACILGITGPCGDPARPEELPAPVIDAITRRMQEEDPQADIRIQLNCPHCSGVSEVRFDIMRFLWEEIEHWAKRIMQEVVFIARHVGWSEKEILGMSPRRRRLYIEMIRP